MTKLTYPGSPNLFINYDYNNIGAVMKIRENGATSGVGVLAQYTYDDMGRRTAVIRGNGHITTYDHDNLSRLTDLEHDAAGTANDLTLAFEYNSAGQITRRERSNTAYDWDIDNLESSSFITNGLNQAIQMYSGPITYDDRGNLTAHSGKTYDYDIFNKLTSVAGTSAQSGNMLNVTYAYDAKGRLLEENDAEIGTITRFAYSGTQLISEFNTNNTVLRRYVHGPGVDEPIVVYEGSGTVNKSWMMADHQGSIIGYTNGNGAVTNINTYSMEGVPGDNNVGRFGYTGQMWLEGAELYHYKARAYDPQLGRFLQADPIGYGDGLNMYAYVGGDAMNYRDPSGLEGEEIRPPEEDEIITTGKRRRRGGGSIGLGVWRPGGIGPLDFGGTGLFEAIGAAIDALKEAIENSKCDKNLVNAGNVLSESGAVLQEVSGYSTIVAGGAALTTVYSFGASSPVTGPLFAGSSYVARFTGIAGTALDVGGATLQSAGTNSWDPLVETGINYISLGFLRRFVPRPLRNAYGNVSDTLDNASAVNDRNSNFRSEFRRYDCNGRI